jgi:N-acetylmuramic acid 6-phosphate (MurNAc-6-P) etherase
MSLRTGTTLTQMRTGSPAHEHHVADRSDLDLRPTLELVELINDEDAARPGRRAPRAGRSPRRSTRSSSGSSAADACLRRRRLVGPAGARRRGRVRPTFGCRRAGRRARRRRRAALAVAQEAAEDDEAAGARDLAGAASAADAVVLLSASGARPTCSAPRAPLASGALTVARRLRRRLELGRLAEHEVARGRARGDRRLDADEGGTAQKLVLNTISTVTMVRLGKTYGNLMVDVVASNAKLGSGAPSAVVIATGAASASRRALEASDGDAKVAIVSLLAGSTRAARAAAPRRGRRCRARARSSRTGREARRRGRDRRRRAASPATSRSPTARSSRSASRRRRRRIAVPGFVDLQVNGFGGVDFAAADAPATPRGEALLETGVTAYQPTLITAPEDELVAALREVPPSRRRPRILGVHLEGPFLSPAGSARTRRGAARSRPRAARAAARAGPVTYVTLRPSCPARSSSSTCSGARRSSSRAGTRTRPPRRRAALRPRRSHRHAPLQRDAAARHRDPGIAGAALARDDVIVQVILDGHHLAPRPRSSSGARRRAARARHGRDRGRAARRRQLPARAASRSRSATASRGAPTASSPAAS